MPEPSEWLDAAAEIVGRVTDRWAAAGALAARRYRLAPRPTTDADLLVEWRDELVPALQAAGYDVVVKAQPGELPHLLFARRGSERVDLIVAEVPFQEVALDRAKDHVLTVEDVIVFKLIAWRARDRDDLASILGAGHDLDEAYIEHWSREWEVLDRWRSARAGRFW